MTTQAVPNRADKEIRPPGELSPSGQVISMLFNYSLGRDRERTMAALSRREISRNCARAWPTCWPISGTCKAVPVHLVLRTAPIERQRPPSGRADVLHSPSAPGLGQEFARPGIRPGKWNDNKLAPPDGTLWRRSVTAPAARTRTV